MSNYYQHQNYYDSPQQHYNNNYQHDAYAMHDMTYPHYESENSYYNKTQRSSQVGTSDYNYEKFARANRRHEDSSCCCDSICCGCCTCCPRWCRWITCILFLLIIGLGIAIGVLAALFKKPNVQFTGLQGDPSFALAGTTTVNLNFTLGFSVDNPNFESVTFKTLVATAYYHGDTTELGGGTLNDLHIGSNSVTSISFPFNMPLDLTSPATQAVAQKLLTDCSSSTKNIQIDYKVVATVSIIGIPISVPVSNTVSFTCPLDSNSASTLSQIQSIIGGLLGGTATSTLPSTSNIPAGVQSLIPSGVASAIASYI